MNDDEKFYELLDAGYAPADAARMARKSLYGGQRIATYTGSGGTDENSTPERAAAFQRIAEESEQRLEESRERLAKHEEQAALQRKLWDDLPDREKRRQAVQWAQRWSTWPYRGSVIEAYRAARLRLERHPSTSKYELAKAACEAARRARASANRKKPTQTPPTGRPLANGSYRPVVRGHYPVSRRRPSDHNQYRRSATDKEQRT